MAMIRTAMALLAVGALATGCGKKDDGNKKGDGADKGTAKGGDGDTKKPPEANEPDFSAWKGRREAQGVAGLVPGQGERDDPRRVDHLGHQGRGVGR